jgi:hypothetical protein
MGAVEDARAWIESQVYIQFLNISIIVFTNSSSNKKEIKKNIKLKGLKR